MGVEWLFSPPSCSRSFNYNVHERKWSPYTKMVTLYVACLSVLPITMRELKIYSSPNLCIYRLRHVSRFQLTSRLEWRTKWALYMLYPTLGNNLTPNSTKNFHEIQSPLPHHYPLDFIPYVSIYWSRLFSILFFVCFGN